MAKHTPPRRARRVLISAIGLGVAAAAAAAVIVQVDRGGEAEPAAGELMTGGPGAAAARLTGDDAGQPLACTELVVATAASFVPVLDALAVDLTTGDGCVNLAVTRLDGRDAVGGLAGTGAHVWIADDVSWASGADDAVIGPPPETPTVIATSPIHVLAGADAAARLGPDGVSWAELAGLGRDPAPPTFVTVAPNASGEGLVAVGAVGEVVWTGAGMDAASGTLNAAASHTRAVAGAVAGEVGPGEIGLLSEQFLIAAGPPTAGRVVMTPSDLTATLRYTWVPTLTGAGDTALDAARARLLDTLTGEAGAASLGEAGLRTADMAQPAVDWLPVTTAPAMEPLARHHVEHVFAAWYEEDRMADHLVVVDVSGSMWAIPEGSDRALLENVKEGVLGVADQLPDSARYGIWEFGVSLDPPRDHRVVIGPAELSAEHRQALADAVGRMRPTETGTGLHDTILAAYLDAQASHRPGVRSQVLLFTDGKNEADPGSLTLEQLGAALAAAADPERPVNLAVVVYGAGAAEVKGPLAEQLKGVRGYVSTAATVTDVANIFAHVAAGGLHG